MLLWSKFEKRISDWGEINTSECCHINEEYRYGMSSMPSDIKCVMKEER